MGVMGGLLVLRAHNSHDGEYEDPNEMKYILHTLLPWGCYRGRRRKIQTTKNQEGTKKFDEKTRTSLWKKRVDFNAAIYILFLLLLTSTKLALDIVYVDEDDDDKGNVDSQGLNYCSRICKKLY